MISKEHAYLVPNTQMTNEKFSPTPLCSQIVSGCLLSHKTSGQLLGLENFHWLFSIVYKEAKSRIQSEFGHRNPLSGEVDQR